MDLNEECARVMDKLFEMMRDAVASCPSQEIEDGRICHGDDCGCPDRVYAEWDEKYGAPFFDRVDSITSNSA